MIQNSIYNEEVRRREAAERKVEACAGEIGLLVEDVDAATRAWWKARQAKDAAEALVEQHEQTIAHLTEAALAFEVASAPADGHPEGQAQWRELQHALLEAANGLRAALAVPEGDEK